LLQIMDSLGLKPAHLVGCSMGASLAIDFALDHPERVSKLVLVGPGISGANFGQKYPDLWAAVKAADEARDLVALNEAELKLFLAGPGRPVESIDKRLRDLFLDMNATSMSSDFDSAPTDDLDPPAVGRLGEIAAPTPVVGGDEDVARVLDATELCMETARCAREAVLDAAGHVP